VATQTLDQILNRDPVRLLLWSASGGGKTTLAGLMAAYEEFYPLYVMDFDLRIASLQAIVPRELWPRIASDPYRDNKIQGEAFLMAQAQIDQLEAKKFKTVVVDSFSFAMQAIMNRVLAIDGKPSTAIPQLQQYNAQKSLAVDFISRLCAKTFNVVVTCHEDTDKDEVTGRLFKSLDLTGKLAGKMPGYFNEFWHCEVTQEPGKMPSYMVRTRGDLVYAARTAYKLEALEPQGKIWGKIVEQRKALAVGSHTPNLGAPGTQTKATPAVPGAGQFQDMGVLPR
jgi:hypothetical protein